MTTPERVPGRYGRRPPKNAPALALAPFLTGVIPAHPGAVDYLAAVGGGWRMLGNGPGPDNAANGVPPGGAGDCVAVMAANDRRLVTVTLTPPGGYWSLAQVVAFYKTQNPRFPAQDDGMDIQTALETLVSVGGPDGVKALGFAKVDVTSPAEVQAAIAIGGRLAVGILVQAANEDQFATGQAWDWSPSSADVGGHAVLAGGYGPEPAPPGPATDLAVGQLGGDVKFITWAQETSFTDAFWSHQVEEAWLVIWPEHMASREFLAGMDVAGFAQAYEQITGRPFPAPVPPAPGPPPPPPPVVDADHTLWGIAGPWAGQHRTRPDLVVLQAALQEWATAKGLS